MKIGQILRQKFSLSFEFFPPKTPEGELDLFNHIKSLEGINPDFVSVTYGAGGGTREKTRQVVSRFAREEKLNVMAHLTCIAHSKQEIIEILSGYKKSDIQNILALRGDSPIGSGIDPNSGEIPHAIDLIRLIKNVFGDAFSIGAAAFPEKHPESASWESEMDHFKRKIDAGADFAVTQLFFNNHAYFDFIDRCRGNHIDIPIIPGIMPITNFKQIRKFSEMCGASIPKELSDELGRFEEDPAEVAKAGLEYAVKQCEKLLENGVPGLHFYTLNKSMATLSIYQALQDKLALIQLVRRRSS